MPSAPPLLAIAAAILGAVAACYLFDRSPLRRTAAQSVLVLSVMLSLAPAFAQTPTQAARDDAKRFGGTLLPEAQRMGTTPPTEDTMPGYSDAPPERRHYDDPDVLAGSGTAAAPGHPGYSAMRESMATRARIAPVDIEETISRSTEIAADPNRYVSGMVDGSASSCTELPPTVASPGRYEQSCSRGFTRGSSSATCAVALRHSVTERVQYRYECSEYDWAANGVDQCAAITASCTTTATRPGRCLVTPICEARRCWCPEPGEPIQQLLCESESPGARLLGRVTTPVVTRGVDDSACRALGLDASCTPAPDVCTDSAPATRTIGGVAVTEACWAWSRTYSCSGLTPRQDCSELERMGCSFLREECITEQDPCLTFDRVYSCPIPPAPVGGPQFICGGDIYCINGECETIEREPNRELGQAAVALNAVAQAGREWDPSTLTLFKGTRHTCSKAVFGLTDCCVPRGLPLIGGCSSEDRILKDKRERGLCTRVGSYCSSEILGVCITRREVHCCYESKLSRLLQEQGRPQLGLAWDRPRRETCRGFTIDEFSRLDLSRMDFSEVIQEFVDAATIPSDLEAARLLQDKVEDYFRANGIGG